MGNVLEHNGKLYVVIKPPEHTMPGKGGAFVQVSMKEITTGTKVNERFRSNEDVEKARLDQKENQFLYADDDFIYLMDNESYEQIQVNKVMLEKKIAYLQEGMNVTVEFYENTPIKIELPTTVNLEVSETEPVVKGQTAASSYKPAVMENGMRIMVPPFVDPGTRVVVRTEDDTYVERCK
jgi:elongation factor P